MPSKNGNYVSSAKNIGYIYIYIYIILYFIILCHILYVIFGCGNERSPAVRTCKADCSALIWENYFVSNTTDGKYFAIDIKPDEIHYKLENYIYLLTCAHRDIQYVAESITAFESKNEISQKRRIKM